MAYTIVKRVGGKYKLRQWIAEHLPSHNVYVEPFGGSFAVGLSLPKSDGAKYRKVFNDVDHHLSNFFQVLRNRPEELIKAINLTPYSRYDFDKAVEYIHSDIDFSLEDPVEWARNFLIFNRQSMFGKEDGSWCISREGENIAQTWDNLPCMMNEVAKLFHGTFIECDDYKKIISRWDSPSTVFYVDPPYLDVEKDFYHANKEDGFDHIRMAEELKKLQGSWVVSYYDKKEIRDLYKGYRVVTKEVNKHMQTLSKKDKAVEILIIHKSNWALDNEPIGDCFDDN